MVEEEKENTERKEKLTSASLWETAEAEDVWMKEKKRKECGEGIWSVKSQRKIEIWDSICKLLNFFPNCQILTEQCLLKSNIVFLANSLAQHLRPEISSKEIQVCWDVYLTRSMYLSLQIEPEDCFCKIIDWHLMRFTKIHNWGMQWPYWELHDHLGKIYQVKKKNIFDKSQSVPLTMKNNPLNNCF